MQPFRVEDLGFLLGGQGDLLSRLMTEIIGMINLLNMVRMTVVRRSCPRVLVSGVSGLGLRVGGLGSWGFKCKFGVYTYGRTLVYIQTPPPQA